MCLLQRFDQPCCVASKNKIGICFATVSMCQPWLFSLTLCPHIWHLPWIWAICLRGMFSSFWAAHNGVILATLLSTPTLWSIYNPKTTDQVVGGGLEDTQSTEHYLLSQQKNWSGLTLVVVGGGLEDTQTTEHQLLSNYLLSQQKNWSGFPFPRASGLLTM